MSASGWGGEGPGCPGLGPANAAPLGSQKRGVSSEEEEGEVDSEVELPLRQRWVSVPPLGGHMEASCTPPHTHTLGVGLNQLAAVGGQL